MIDILKAFGLFTIVFIHVKETLEVQINNLFVDDTNSFSTVFWFITSVHPSPLNSWCFLFMFSVFLFRAFATKKFWIEIKIQLHLLNWTQHIVDVFTWMFLVQCVLHVRYQLVADVQCTCPFVCIIFIISVHSHIIKISLMV